MIYTVDLVEGAHRTTGLSYNAATKALTAVNARVTIETGADYTAYLIDGDYVMIFDAAGMSFGDLVHHSPDDTRLEFMAIDCQGRRRIATLTKQGILAVNDVVEGPISGTGMNISDRFLLGNDGVMTVPDMSEIWLLANELGNYITEGGLLISL